MTIPNSHPIAPHGGAWDNPAPIQDAAPAEPFPIEALPGPMRRMAEAVALSMPCPVDMPACTMLAAASAAIGATRQLKVKTSWYELPRLWLAVVARPGSKKSPSAKNVLGPIRRAQKRLRREHEAAMEKYKASLAEWKRQTEEAIAARQNPPDKPHEPIERQLEVGDTTREALCDLLRENWRGVLVYRDELTGWANSLNQYKAGKGDDRQFWLSLWSGEPVFVNRRGRRLYAEEPFASIVGNLPPAVLGELSDNRAREDGWIHRILFAWPEEIEMTVTKAEPDPLTLDDYEKVFVNLFALESGRDSDGEPVPRTLRFSHDADDRWTAFVNALYREMKAEDFPEELRGPWAKMEGYCVRLALLLHVCRQACGETSSEEVDRESVENAIRLVRYFQAHARRVYPQLLHDGGDRLRQDAEAILAWVRRNGERIRPADDDGKPALAFTWRMIRRDLARRFEGRDEDLRKALQALESRGYLREVARQREAERGRRPESDYLVNPACLSGACAVPDTRMTLGKEPTNNSGKNGERHASCCHAEAAPAISTIGGEPCLRI